MLYQPKHSNLTIRTWAITGSVNTCGLEDGSGGAI